MGGITQPAAHTAWLHFTPLRDFSSHHQRPAALVEQLHAVNTGTFNLCQERAGLDSLQLNTNEIRNPCLKASRGVKSLSMPLEQKPHDQIHWMQLNSAVEQTLMLIKYVPLCRAPSAPSFSAEIPYRHLYKEQNSNQSIHGKLIRNYSDDTMTVNFSKNSEESNILEFGFKICWIRILEIQQGPADLLMICE